MDRMFRRLFAGLSFFAASACAYNPYPGDWAPQLERSDCQSFIGTYDQVGQGSNARIAPFARLSRLLDPDNLSGLTSEEHEAITQVRIRLSNKEISVEALDAVNPISSWSVSPKSESFECEEGKIVFHQTREFVGDEPQSLVIGVEWEQRGIVLASDKSLIIERRGGGAGTAFLIIPIGATGRDYYRFPLIAED